MCDWLIGHIISIRHESSITHKFMTLNYAYYMNTKLKMNIFACYYD